MSEPRKKTVHMSMFFDGYGNVSALCFKAPHAIDLKKTTWTNRPDAVTCPRCRAALQYGRAVDALAKPLLRGFPS